MLGYDQDRDHPPLSPFRLLKVCQQVLYLTSFFWMLHVKSTLCHLSEEHSLGVVSAHYFKYMPKIFLVNAWITDRHVCSCAQSIRHSLLHMYLP
jgi:hypothetical protein